MFRRLLHLATSFLILLITHVNLTQAQEASPSDRLPTPQSAAAEAVPAHDQPIQPLPLPAMDVVELQETPLLPVMAAAAEPACRCRRCTADVPHIMARLEHDPPLAPRDVPVHEMVRPFVDQAEFQWIWVTE